MVGNTYYKLTRHDAVSLGLLHPNPDPNTLSSLILHGTHISELQSQEIKACCLLIDGEIVRMRPVDFPTSKISVYPVCVDGHASKYCRQPLVVQLYN